MRGMSMSGSGMGSPLSRKMLPLNSWHAQPSPAQHIPGGPTHGCVRGLPCSALRSLLQARS